jgi:cyanate permease
MEVRSLMLDGLKQIAKTAPFWLFVIVYFFGMGMFNGINTWINGIFSPRNFNANDAGLFGGLMIVGGIIGAVIIPSLSDREHKRQRYLLLGVLLAIPGLVGIAFATSRWLLYLSSFAFGFFLISLAPIGLQYVAEVTYPAPEGTSAGVIQWFGQVSFIFVILMDAIKSKNGAYTPSLVLSIILLLVMAGVITQMKDPVPHTAGAVAQTSQD